VCVKQSAGFECILSAGILAGVEGSRLKVDGAWLFRWLFGIRGKTLRLRRPFSYKQMRHVGLEATTEPQDISENQQIQPPGAAKASVAVSLPVVADADLRTIVEAWPNIPPAMRAGIVAMVKTATTGFKAG
jgi:hypothetical protein